MALTSPSKEVASNGIENSTAMNREPSPGPGAQDSYPEVNDTVYGQQIPYMVQIPLAVGEKVLEELETEEFEFIPSQEPRTVHDVPESRCSTFPIGPVTLRISILRNELHGEVYDVLMILCIRKGDTIGSLKALFAKHDPPSPVFSNHLRSVYDDNGKLRRNLINDPKMSGSGVWGIELEVGDCMFIDSTGVLDDWEGLGIGKKMANIALEKAKERGVRYVFTYPHSWDHRERRARYGQLDWAIGYWRSMGFRRVGTLADFCYSIDPAHPSRRIASGEDFDPPKPETRNISDKGDEEKW